ncbi:hypothetical protein D9613_000270 [Agrocybe pediades]|uniref:Uncharacterized protein n=1 Tax=Agrocybe pediades TaxID=84607 RepID=A0A8H4VSK8_9AGAR|nr:hypothetical protein D9613_000270 [Agrocybe pediades]
MLTTPANACICSIGRLANDYYVADRITIGAAAGIFPGNSPGQEVSAMLFDASIEFCKEQITSFISISPLTLEIFNDRLAVKLGGVTGLSTSLLSALAKRNGRLVSAALCVLLEFAACLFLIQTYGFVGALERTIPIIALRIKDICLAVFTRVFNCYFLLALRIVKYIAHSFLGKLVWNELKPRPKSGSTLPASSWLVGRKKPQGLSPSFYGVVVAFFFAFSVDRQPLAIPIGRKLQPRYVPDKDRDTDDHDDDEALWDDDESKDRAMSSENDANITSTSSAESQSNVEAEDAHRDGSVEVNKAAVDQDEVEEDPVAENGKQVDGAHIEDVLGHALNFVWEVFLMAVQAQEWHVQQLRKEIEFIQEQYSLMQETEVVEDGESIENGSLDNSKQFGPEMDMDEGVVEAQENVRDNEECLLEEVERSFSLALPNAEEVAFDLHNAIASTRTALEEVNEGLGTLDVVDDIEASKGDDVGCIADSESFGSFVDTPAVSGFATADVFEEDHNLFGMKESISISTSSVVSEEEDSASLLDGMKSAKVSSSIFSHRRRSSLDAMVGMSFAVAGQATSVMLRDEPIVVEAPRRR